MTYDTINNAQTVAVNGEGTFLAGRYRVVRQLGAGGMGSVWLAEDTQLDNKPFAIKMLPSILVANKRAYRQLKDEALVAMKLTHPNIVTLRAFEENNGNPFLVMDYIDGQTLDDYLAEHFSADATPADVARPPRPCCKGEGALATSLGTTGGPPCGGLPEAEVIRILTPIAAALDYAHGEGVVHRDVKPANVMIRKDGHPFILDFGIAREIQETMTRVTGKNSSGTLLYMSPEQLHGASPKPAQDIYSFAAMVYECLKGAPPFVRGQVEYQIDNDMPDPIPDGVAIGPPVMSGLAKKPEARPSSCADVLFVREQPAQPKIEGHSHQPQAPDARVPGTEKVNVAQRFIPKEDWRYLPPEMRPTLGGDEQDGDVSNASQTGKARLPRQTALKGLFAVVALGLAAFGGWWWVSGRNGTVRTSGKETSQVSDVSSVPDVPLVPSVAPIDPAPTPAAKPVTPASSAHVVFKAGHKGVQLWKDGPYWAETNIGAEKPEDFGYYFWWGDTVGYKRDNYAWMSSDGSTLDFSFAHGNTQTWNKDLSSLQLKGWIVSENGTCVLAPEHDAAHVQWGGGWRMPTFQELLDMVSNCDWTWTTNRVKGYVVSGKGDYGANRIFLPASGEGDDTSLIYPGSCGSLWSSEPMAEYFAEGLSFSPSYHGRTVDDRRYYGRSVRPVLGFTQ